MESIVGRAQDERGRVDHSVYLHGTDEELRVAVASFIASGLRAADPVLVIATADHRAAFERSLAELGVDVVAALDRGELAFLDAHDTLAKLMRDGVPDRALFQSAVGDRVVHGLGPLEPPRRLRVYGEMVDVLWRSGQRSEAILLEELWTDLQRRHPLTLLCAYAPLRRGPVQDLERELAERDEVESALRGALRALGASEDAARKNEAELRRVTDALPVLVSFIDADERYRFTSAAYERWFGRPGSTLIGASLEEVVGAEGYARIAPQVRRALDGHAVRYEVVVPYAQGGPRFVDASYVPQFGADGKVIGFVALVEDIGERKAFEAYRATAAERAERLATITGSIADAVTRDEVFDALVDQVARALEASSLGLWLVDRERRALSLARSIGYADEARSTLETVPLDATPSAPMLDAVRGKVPIRLASREELVERYPHLRSVATPGRSYRVGCLPLLVRDDVIGVIGVTIEGRGAASEDEHELLLLVAKYATQAIERLRLVEAAQRSRAEADAAAGRLRALNEASRAFVQPHLDLESRLDAVLRTLGGALSSAVGLALVESDGSLHTRGLHHPVPEAEELLRALAKDAPVPLGEGVMGEVLTSGKSVLLDAVAPAAMIGRAAPSYRAFLERFPVHAMVCVPLRSRGKILGALTATRVKPGETYSTEDLLLFEELAERAAAAIDNSRLYQETLDAQRRAEQLYRFAEVVMASETLELVYAAALSAIQSGLGARRCAILTFDVGGTLRFRAWRHLSDAYRATVEGHSPWPRDVTAPAPVLVTDVTRDPALAPYGDVLRAERIGALAFIPLVSGGRLIGKFMMYFEERHAFSPHEVEMARAIANHLSSVISRFQVLARHEDTIRQNELFTGVLAHDLRNPLGAMTMAAELVLRRSDGAPNDARIRRPLERIVSSGHRMSSMIEQLLDFTRARSGGGMAIEPVETDLGQLVAQVVGELELGRPDWKIRLDAVGNLKGLWDPGRLLQAASNLLGNAGQHGKQGGIFVRVDGTVTHAVELEVHNAGTIPHELLPQLFEPFLNTKHRSEGSSGLGLGLFIVQEIARAHGGKVDVRSSEALGTTFTIRLPRRASTALRAAKR